MVKRHWLIAGLLAALAVTALTGFEAGRRYPWAIVDQWLGRGRNRSPLPDGWSRRATIPMARYEAGSIVAGLDHVATRNTLIALDVVDARSRLLGVATLIEEAALDNYSFVRDVYLQRRSNEVFDGNVPEEPNPKK